MVNNESKQHEFEEIDLSYDQILRRHLDRISKLSVFVLPGQMKEIDRSLLEIDLENIKKRSMAISVMTLRAMLLDKHLEGIELKYSEGMSYEESFTALNKLLNAMDAKGLLTEMRAISVMSRMHKK